MAGDFVVSSSLAKDLEEGYTEVQLFPRGATPFYFILLCIFSGVVAVAVTSPCLTCVHVFMQWDY